MCSKSEWRKACQESQIMRELWEKSTLQGILDPEMCENVNTAVYISPNHCVITSKSATSRIRHSCNSQGCSCNKNFIWRAHLNGPELELSPVGEARSSVHHRMS